MMGGRNDDIAMDQRCCKLESGCVDGFEVERSVVKAILHSIRKFEGADVQES
jgi:hypothetical protein